MITYTDVEELTKRPAVFSEYTAERLWADPHLSEQMLAMHLSQDTDLASRPLHAIDRVVSWINETFGLEGARVCDLGCGPGLYASRYAEHGAIVHGIDFSAHSIAYAQKHTPAQAGSVVYDVGDYLKAALPQAQDLATLIYCDLCPLSPVQRSTLLAKVHQSLSPGGAFVFDVISDEAFERVVEGTTFELNLMNGFWSAEDYFGFKQTFRYEPQRVSLDRYTIIEKDRTWNVYNWLQFFTKDEITRELKEAGFSDIQFTEGFGEDPHDRSTFGIIARP